MDLINQKLKNMFGVMFSGIFQKLFFVMKEVIKSHN